MLLFKNKKGEGIVSIIMIVFFLFILLIGGVMLAFGGITLDWVVDTAVPELTTVGMVGSTNMSSIASTVFTPVNKITNSFSWFAGVIYILALLGVLGFAVGFRITGSKWLMGFFIGCMLLLVIASIFISNIYEEFYNDTGEVADRLHEYGLLSFMILYSPVIMCVIGFVGGIIMFSGIGGEEASY